MSKGKDLGIEEKNRLIAAEAEVSLYYNPGDDNWPHPLLLLLIQASATGFLNFLVDLLSC